jgi:hypothetical protein
MQKGNYTEMTILDMRDLKREFGTIFAIQSLHTLFLLGQVWSHFRDMIE